MDGWFLRSYPHRQPIETRPDGWERYLDEPSGREWFYNKYTQESQYFAPQVFLSDRESHLAPKSDQKPTENGLEEWAKYFDAQSGYEYYYNHKTLESTYSRPVEYFTPRDAPLVSSRLEKGDKDWAKYFDPVSGHNYYYNHRTMESSFSRPIDFFTPRATPRFDETPLESGGNGWGKYYDATTQGHYYYNAMTNESSYMRPQEFATPRASENGKAEEPGQLEKYLDQESGQYYYYNRSTTEVKRVAPG
jgi:hypothetical protein